MSGKTGYLWAECLVGSELICEKKTVKTLKSNLFAKKVNSCECFVVLHLCFTYADASINSDNLKSQKFSQR